jgi:quinol monooxygenase YgiN
MNFELEVDQVKRSNQIPDAIFQYLHQGSEIHLVIIFVRINVRSEKRKELMQTLHSIVEDVRRQNGCRHAGCYQDAASENDFLLVEEWATRKDLDGHLRSEIFTVLLGAGSLMVRPPEVVVHTVSRSTELEV